MARFRIHDVSPLQMLDRIFLIAAFALGAAGTVLLKIYDFPVLAIALLPVAVLSAYVIACFAIGRLSIEPESIGDNCYYLGFLFTLTSLAVTLYQIRNTTGVGDASFVPKVISGFGVALTSTIAGVFLRVLLMQMRPDIVARDREARRDLSLGARDFRGAITSATRDLKVLAAEMNQRAVERERKAVEISNTHAEIAQELLNKQAMAYTNALSEYAKDFGTKLTTAITEESKKSVAVLGTAANDAAARLNMLAEDRAGEVKSLRDATAGLVECISKFRSEIELHSEGFAQTYTRLGKRAQEIVTALEAVPIPNANRPDNNEESIVQAAARPNQGSDSHTNLPPGHPEESTSVVGSQRESSGSRSEATNSQGSPSISADPTHSANPQGTGSDAPNFDISTKPAEGQTRRFLRRGWTR